MKSKHILLTCVETLRAAFPQHFRSISAILMLLTFSSVFGQANNAMPLIRNMGQLKYTNGAAATDVKFYTQTSKQRCLFQDNRVIYQFDKVDSTALDSLFRVDMEFLNANPSPTLTGLNAGGYFNFYTNSANVSQVQSYGNVRYTNLYSGIDLNITNLGEVPTYEYTVNPSVNSPSVVKMKWVGANSLSIVNNSLFVNTSAGVIEYKQPSATQVINGQSQNVAVTLTISGQVVSFSLGGYNNAYPLQIALTGTPNTAPTPAPPVTDPYRPDWVTFLQTTSLGGSRIQDIDTDTDGNLFVSGWTASPLNPVNSAPGSFHQYQGNYDAFVIKFSPYRSIVWANYFGGSRTEHGTHVEVQGTGVNQYVFLVGTTYSDDIGILLAQTPVSNTYSSPPITSPAPGDNLMFIAKFNNQGLMGPGAAPNTFWSYFGISNNNAVSGTVDIVSEFLVDASGNAYMGGYSFQSIPTKSKVGAYNSTFGSGYVAKFTPSNGALVLDWCTGIEGVDIYGRVLDMALNTTGTRLYVLGASNISASALNAAPFTGNTGGNLPLVDPNTSSSIEYIQAKSQGHDYFIISFNSTGSIGWSTMFGGTGDENVFTTPGGSYGTAPFGTSPGQIAVDKNNRLYITGTTASQSAGSYPFFPTKTLTGTGKYNDNTYNGGSYDSFIARFTSAYQLDWCTYMGTTGDDAIKGISTNGAGRVYLVGDLYNIANAGTWPTKSLTNAYFSASPVTIPGYAYTRGNFITQFTVDGSFYYSTYYGATDFEMHNVMNATTDAQFYFVGQGGPMALAIPTPTNSLGSAAYYYAPPSLIGPYAAVVGQFTFTCTSCQRASDFAVESVSTEDFTLFPNPFSDGLTLQNTNSQIILEAKWLDMTGKVLHTQTINSNAQELALEVYALSTGCYILQIQTEKGLTTIKLLKNK